MRENVDQNDSEYGYFLGSVTLSKATCRSFYIMKGK